EASASLPARVGVVGPKRARSTRVLPPARGRISRRDPLRTGNETRPLPWATGLMESGRRAPARSLLDAATADVLSIAVASAAVTRDFASLPSPARSASTRACSNRVRGSEFGSLVQSSPAGGRSPRERLGREGRIHREVPEVVARAERVQGRLGPSGVSIPVA